jgi:signal transduction histidine kinase
MTAQTSGWAKSTLDRCLWQASAAGLAAWQAAVGAVVAWRTPEHATVLVLVHAVVLVTGLVATLSLTSLAVRGLWFTLLTGVLVADLALAGDDLAVVVISMSFVVVATPFLALPWWWAAGWGFPGLAAGAAVLAVSGVDKHVVVAVVVPATFFVLVAGLLRRTLVRVARDVDTLSRAADHEQERLVEARAAATAAAEHVRTLHDTVVNTLAALAQGGAAVAHPDLVRQRCRADALAVRGLDRAATEPVDLGSLGRGLPVELRWEGASAEQLRALAGRLTPSRGHALRSVLDELLLNVAKHASGRPALLRVATTSTALVVEVRDDGPGFDVSSTRGGYGLEHSVHGRASEHGIAVEVSSRPGGGTTARVLCPWVGWQVAPSTQSSVLQARGDIQRAGTWGWCWGVGGAGLLSTLATTSLPLSYASPVLVLALSLLAWWRCRDGGSLPTAYAAMLSAGVPVAFGLGFLGAHGAGGDPLAWQAIGLTPLLVVLLTSARPAWLLLALLLLVGATTACVTAGPDDLTVRGSALANASVQIAQLGVWVIFTQVLARLAARSAAARDSVLRDRSERAALEASSRTRDWWREAQVERSLALLEEVASGRVDPTSPEVARRAGREERPLRQLLLLGPHQAHLGPWLARAIGRARERDVDLTVRVGDADLPDAPSAAQVGAQLLELVSTVPRGTDLVVACFGSASTSQLTVVAPAGVVASAPVHGSVLHHHGDQDLLELVPPARPGPGGAGDVAPRH